MVRVLGVACAALMATGCSVESPRPSSGLSPTPVPALSPAPVPSLSPAPPPGSVPSPLPPPASSGSCSLSARQSWAEAEIREFYLFPELLPASVDASRFSSVQGLIDELTAEARAQGKDRFFTFITSIAEEDAFIDSGETAAFGIRIQSESSPARVVVADAFEGAPALAAGIDRGTEILAIGINEATLRDVSAIIASEGTDGISAALGPGTPGLQRVLRVRALDGSVRLVTLTKTVFDIPPVSSRFGVRVIDADGTRTGYVNLRTFVGTADPALRQAFADLRREGVRQFIIDFRYNGGGLVRIAELMGDLLGGNRQTSEVFNEERFRPSKSEFDFTKLFDPTDESVSPLRLAFIGTDATASASELVINAFTPYFPDASVLVGENTFGKPVGQIARDRPICGDRLRVVAFAGRNAAGQGDYFNGLASEVAATCAAEDDLRFAMGDPREASTARALDFLAGRPCAPIIGARTASLSGVSERRRAFVLPETPDVVSREVPGLF